MGCLVGILRNFSLDIKFKVPRDSKVLLKNPVTPFDNNIIFLKTPTFGIGVIVNVVDVPCDEHPKK